MSPFLLQTVSANSLADKFFGLVRKFGKLTGQPTVMKKLFLGLSLSILSFVTMAQGNMVLSGNRSSTVFFVAKSGFGEKGIEDIDGTPFLATDWSTGSVKFRNGKIAKEATLMFSVYNNRLYFKQGGEVFEFVDPVKEFTINYRKDDVSISPLYRNGYPAFAKNTTETFYEVLVDGKLQLLELQYKTIGKFRETYSDPEKKRFEDKSVLYAFLPNNDMVRLINVDNDLIKAIPEQETAIKDIIKKQRLKLKNREDVVKLFQALNQQ